VKLAKAASAASLSLLLLAASDSPLAAGLWEIRNTPGVATLDGRPLDELPLSPIKSETICLAAAEANDPVRFLTRDMGEDCSIGDGIVKAGGVAIAGSCPNQLEGPDGSFKIIGRLDSVSYEVDFATTAVGDNGKMTFSGKMTGRRIGDCAG
jgi:hypothetical protein